MGNEAIAIVIMLLSAACYALSYVLQHKGTQAAIGVDAEGEGLARLLKSPIYLVGVVLFGVSFILHLTALSFGSVGIVQPLIVTELIFIPPFASIISHAKISRKDWLNIVAITAGLIAFLFVAKPKEGETIPSSVQWAALIIGTYVLYVVLVLIGRRLNPNLNAMLCGTGAGLVAALLALTAKGAFNTSNFLASPLFYITLLVAVSAISTTAIAFRNGPITTSTPAMISVTPVVSTLVAMWLFGDTINTAPLALVIIAICIVVIVYGVIALSRSEAVHSALADSVEVELEVEVEADVKAVLHPKKDGKAR